MMKVALLILVLAVGGLAFLLHFDSAEPATSPSINKEGQQLTPESTEQAETAQGPRTITVPGHKPITPTTVAPPATMPKPPAKRSVIPEDSEMIRWVKDEDELAQLDAEMGLQTPTELDQLRFEDELAEAKAQLPEVTDEVTFIPLEEVEEEDTTPKEDFMITEPLDDNAEMDEI